MQDSLGYGAGAPGNKETDESEAIRQTTVENEIAKWRVKETKRIEKRLRGKLARDGQQPMNDRGGSDVPRAARQIPRAARDVPRAARPIPRAARDVPRAARDQPEGYGARGPPVRSTRTTPVAVPPDKPPSPEPGEMRLLRPVYTRMARKYLSMESLNHFGMDYIIENPEYFLIKKFVPEPEQDMLWDHTRDLRTRRRRIQVEPSMEINTATSTSAKLDVQATFKDFVATERMKKMATEIPPFPLSRSPSPDQVENQGSAEIEATTPTATTSVSSGSNQFSRFVRNTTNLSLAPPGKSGGLRIESGLSSTISRDNVMGNEAREAELLAQFGKKQFSLRLCNLQSQGKDIAGLNQAQQDASSVKEELRPPPEKMQGSDVTPLKSNEGEEFHIGDVRRARARAQQPGFIEFPKEEKRSFETALELGEFMKRGYRERERTSK